MNEEKKNPFNLKMAIIYILFMKDLLEENEKLKKQLEKRNELLNKSKIQQQEFIKYLEEIQFVPSITVEDFEEDYTITEVLQKYKEIIGDDKE